MRVDGDERRLQLRRGRTGEGRLDLELGEVDVWKARRRPRWFSVDRWVVVQGDRRWCAYGAFEAASGGRDGDDPSTVDAPG